MNAKDQTPEQLRKFVQFLLASRKGEEMSGIEAMRKFYNFYGIMIDHHVYVEVLDYMAHIGMAKCTQGWGDTRYLIN